MPVNIGVETQSAGRAQVHLPRREIFDFTQIAARRRRGEKQVLAKAQRALGMGFVKSDDFRETMHISLGRPVA